MAHTMKPRPVSGEIMTSPAQVNAAGATDEIIDAEFVTLPAQPSRRERVAATARTPDGMDMLRAAPAGPAQPSRGGPLFWLAGAAAIATAFWVSGGHEVFQTGMPGGGAAKGALRIVDVTSDVVQRGGRPLLRVDGAALNDGETAARVPMIEIRVADAGGRVTRYKLGTADRALDPGQRFDFSSRLQVPKDGVTGISVAFSGDYTDAGREGQGY